MPLHGKQPGVFDQVLVIGEICHVAKKREKKLTIVKLTVHVESSTELGHVAPSDVDGDCSGDYPVKRRCLQREPYRADRDGTVESFGRVLVRPRHWREPGAPSELQRRVKLQT